MRLKTYLKQMASGNLGSEDQAGLVKLTENVHLGRRQYFSLDETTRRILLAEFWNRVRTEELKAWYGAREGNSLFQGTSVSALTIPACFSDPVDLISVDQLEDMIADQYIHLHDKHAQTVQDAILENMDNWLAQGLFFGVMIGSKVISQAFGLAVAENEIVFEQDGIRVDPHEITSYPPSVREAYFAKCLTHVDCFEEMDLKQHEFEQSLVLADISKPKLSRYHNKLILGPVRCNEIAALISRNVVKRIHDKTSGRISPRSMQVGIYDSDTPYTYHVVSGWVGRETAPVLPGITLLGTSGSVSAFRWLYFYRMALIAQKLMKSSLYSEVAREFMPFVFFGVLVPRDAEILLDMNRLSELRYRGQLSPEIEFFNLVPNLMSLIQSQKPDSFETDFLQRVK